MLYSVLDQLQATCHAVLGESHYFLAAYDHSEQHLSSALALSRRLGNSSAEARPIAAIRVV